MKPYLTPRVILGISIGIALIVLLALPLHGLSFGLYDVLFFCFVTLMIFAILEFIEQKVERETDKARIELARKILRIAQQTLPYLKQGLDVFSAKQLADTLYTETNAIAVAVTDLKKVLAFVGAGADHHYTGKKITTLATKKTLKKGKMMVLLNAKDIGCPAGTHCPLQAAILLPLMLDSKIVGSLKFYYDSKDSVTDAEIAMVEGLTHLIENQLQLSQVSRLETMACEAELKALQAQVNPHFFFNVLNTAVAYCRSDPKEARRVLLDFSNFFRMTIESGDEPLITLDSELNYLSNYIELEKARFGDRLIYKLSVPKRLRVLRLPPFTLQPIVENSINRGFPSDRPLVLEVRAVESGDLIILEVKDSGIGIPHDKLPTVLLRGSGEGLGVGLSLINDRLKLLFGDEYGLTVESQLDRGTTVRVIVPRRARVASI